MAIAKAIQEGAKVAYVGPVIPNKTPNRGDIGVINRMIFPKDGGQTLFEVGFPDGTVYTAPYAGNWITEEDYSSAKAQTYIALTLTAAAVVGIGIWLATRK